MVDTFHGTIRQWDRVLAALGVGTIFVLSVAACASQPPVATVTPPAGQVSAALPADATSAAPPAAVPPPTVLPAVPSPPAAVPAVVPLPTPTASPPPGTTAEVWAARLARERELDAAPLPSLPPLSAAAVNSLAPLPEASSQFAQALREAGMSATGVTVGVMPMARIGGSQALVIVDIDGPAPDLANIGLGNLDPGPLERALSTSPELRAADIRRIAFYIRLNREIVLIGASSPDVFLGSLKGSLPAEIVRDETFFWINVPVLRQLLEGD